MRTLTSRCPLQRNYRLNNKKLVDNAGFERRDLYRGRKINCVMRRFFPSSSVGDRPAPRGCTSTPDERKVTTI